MFAEYIDWRAEHPSDDLMTELLQRRVRGRDRHGPAPHPRGAADLHHRGRRRRQRDDHPPDRLGRQGAGRPPRPAPRAGRGPLADPERHRGAAPLRAAGAPHGPVRRPGRRGHGRTVPEGSVMLFLVGARPTATTAAFPKATASTSTATSDSTSRSATASTSAWGPRWPASRVASRSTRSSAGSRRGTSTEPAHGSRPPRPSAAGRPSRYSCRDGPRSAGTAALTGRPGA